jgi:Na+/proline symporter
MRNKSFTTTLTVGVLVGYVTILTIVLLFIISADKNEPVWTDIVKTGFTTLGSAFTLILGYYYGHRPITEVNEAIAKADENAISEKEENQKKVAALIDNFTDKKDPSQPDSLENIDKSKLPTRT